MKKTFFLTLFSVAILVSCKKNNNPNTEHFHFSFKPRTCEKIIIFPCKLTLVNGATEKGVVTLGSQSVKATDYILALFSGDRMIDSIRKYCNFTTPDKTLDQPEHILYFDANLVAPNLTLENQLESDYRRYSSNGYKTSSSARSVYANDNNIAFASIIPWPYRTTGVKNFTITALSTLFGKAPGSSLNSYFNIHDFNPRQIINYQTKQLAWGYNDVVKVQSIDQWLSLKPTAQPLMYLNPNTVPPEVPGIVKLVVTLELENGLLTSDTTTVSFSN